MNELPKLFGKDSRGKIKQWSITTAGAEVVIRHGKVGGKITEKRTTSAGKNVGRSNATTPAEQAVLEAESKWRKQIKKDYAELIEAIPESTLPNLATKLQDKKHTLNYDVGVDALCKLDGVRCSVFLKDGEVFFQSRGGEAYPVIQEIADELWLTYLSKNANYVVDGEIYSHGMHLEDITSAVKKHNEDTPRLEFHIFDLVDKTKPEETWFERYNNYMRLFLGNPQVNRLDAVGSIQVYSYEEIMSLHDSYVRDGYEGIVVRPWSGVNSFGNRTADFIKYKKRLDEEFRVVRMEEDKNGCAIPICMVEVEKPTKTTLTLCGIHFEEFKAPLTGTQERNQAIYQEYVNNGHKIVDSRSWLKVEFEAYSKYNKPAKPKGTCFRNCDPVTGEPLE